MAVQLRLERDPDGSVHHRPGAGAILASTIIDLAGLKKTVRRHNLKVQSLQAAVAPVLSPRTKAADCRCRSVSEVYGAPAKR